MSVAQVNIDLEWSLDRFEKRENARSFVKQFEGLLCVYSPTVEQIYSSYSMDFPQRENAKMVVLPNPFAFHDTFNSVDQSAVVDTGLYIIPGAMVKQTGLYLMPANQSKAAKVSPLPLRQAIAKMLASQDSNDPFLPILMKGDLREFKAEYPCLHLHRIKIKQLSRLSIFQQKDIQKSIVDKLKLLASRIPASTTV